MSERDRTVKLVQDVMLYCALRSESTKDMTPTELREILVKLFGESIVVEAYWKLNS